MGQITKIVVTDLNGHETTFNGEGSYMVRTMSKKGDAYQQRVEAQLLLPASEKDIKA